MTKFLDSEMVIDITSKLFTPSAVKVDYTLYDEIHLDLSSITSILFRYFDQPNQNIIEPKIDIKYMVRNTIMEPLLGFILNTVVAKNCKVRIYFTNKEDGMRKNIYPEWEHDRYSRWKSNNELKFMLDRLVKSSLEETEKQIPDKIKVVYNDNIPIDIIIYERIRLSPKEMFHMIISRNTTTMCNLVNAGVHWYNGSIYFYKGGEAFIENSGKYPKIPPIFIPIYITLVGDTRYGYNGGYKYGKVKTTKLIKENYIQLLSNDYSCFEKANVPTKNIALFDSGKLKEHLSDVQLKHLLDIV